MKVPCPVKLNWCDPQEIQVDLLQHLVRSAAPTEGEESDYCEPPDQI